MRGKGLNEILEERMQNEIMLNSVMNYYAYP